MKPVLDTLTLEAAIQRNLDELNNAILKITAHDELVRQELTYNGMSFFVIAKHALYNDMLAHAIRVLDVHSDAVSFWYVHRCNEKVINKAAHSAGLNLAELKVLSEKLRLVRTKTLFHIDRRAVQAPEAVWEEAGIDGFVFAQALEAMASTLAQAKQEMFGGELDALTAYDGSDVAKIISAYEANHGPVHGT